MHTLSNLLALCSGAVSAAVGAGVACVDMLCAGSMGCPPMSVYSAPADYSHMAQQQQQEEPVDDNQVRSVATSAVRSAVLWRGSSRLCWTRLKLL
jgi:hypothetical protein